VKKALKNKTDVGAGIILAGKTQQLAIAKLMGPDYFVAREHALVMAAQLESVNGRCLNDQVLVKRTDPKEKFGRIFIPATAQEKSEQGIVVAVGPGLMNDQGMRIPLDIHVGDGVKFSKYYGTPTEIGGVEFLQLREAEVEFAAGVPRSDEEKAKHSCL
jgi:chaperonin GroES